MPGIAGRCGLAGAGTGAGPAAPVLVPRRRAPPVGMGDDGGVDSRHLTRSTRRIIALVAALNLLGMLGEAVVAAWIGSAALFADAADFLEDVLITVLVLVAASWPVAARRRAALALAALILLPAAAAVAMAIWRLIHGGAPEPIALGVTGLVAMAINAVCAVLLSRLRRGHGALVRGAWLAARNDVLGNLLIVAAGALTLVWLSPWPDVVVGAVMAVVNGAAALEVHREARKESPELELDGG